MKNNETIKNFFTVDEDIKIINQIGRMGALTNMFFALLGIILYSLVIGFPYVSVWVQEQITKIQKETIYMKDIKEIIYIVSIIALIGAPLSFIANWRHYFGIHNKHIAGIMGILFSGALLVFLAGGIIGGIMVLSGTNNKLKPTHKKHINNKNFIKAGALVSAIFAIFFAIFFGILSINWIINDKGFFNFTERIWFIIIAIILTIGALITTITNFIYIKFNKNKVLAGVTGILFGGFIGGVMVLTTNDDEIKINNKGENK